MFRFKTLPGGSFSYRPSDLVLALAQHLDQMFGSYVVLSPYGTLVFDLHFSVFYLVRESHPVSGLWRYFDGRMHFVSRVDASALDRDFVGRVVHRASRAGFYGGDTVLPIVHSSELGVDDAGWCIAIPHEMFPDRGVIQHDRLTEFVRGLRGNYYAMPEGSVLKRDSSTDVLEFSVQGTAVALITRHGVLAHDPLADMFSRLESLSRLPDELRLPKRSGALPSVTVQHEGVRRLLPHFRLGLLAAVPTDPFVRALQTRKVPDRFRRALHAVRTGSKAGGNAPFEVLGVYRSLDGSTGRTVWYVDGPFYQPKRKVYELCGLLRVYHLYTDDSTGWDAHRLVNLFMRIPGSVLYSCPTEASEWPFSALFEVTDDGRARLVRQPSSVYSNTMFYRLKVSHVLLDTGLHDRRWILPASTLVGTKAHPILLSRM